ncbi:hypothetical protein N7523_004177 [Penicillium sp. IBT 18751x]|nr:hypothetical protein N7523_004177 [Penicillium sp. IBT 18751x]
MVESNEHTEKQQPNRDSEGLIPVETPSHSGTGAVSPLDSGNIHTAPSVGASTLISDASEKPPLHGDYDAPTPVYPGEPAKSYQGQPHPDHTNGAFTGQYPMNSASDVKTYPGQPSPHPQQPGMYYTPYGHPSGYATATPLHSLLSAPSPVDCPCCGKREMTRTEAVSGGTTHAWAAILCFFCCLGCIPYLMSSLKDVDHYCGACGAKIAIWHNSGRIEVLQNGQRP